jgi:hypothetical protein
VSRVEAKIGTANSKIGRNIASMVSASSCFVCALGFIR